jgi:hypothetical protein
MNIRIFVTSENVGMIGSARFENRICQTSDPETIESLMKYPGFGDMIGGKCTVMEVTEKHAQEENIFEVTAPDPSVTARQAKPAKPKPKSKSKPKSRKPKPKKV